MRNRVSVLLSFIVLLTFCPALVAKPTENYIRLTLSESEVPQGSVITVFVLSAHKLEEARLHGFKRTYKLFRIWHEDADNLFRGFLPVSALTKPGQYQISVKAKDSQTGQVEISSTISVKNAKFRTQTIALPNKKKKLMDVESLVQESREIVAALRQIDSKVYFASQFIKPVNGRISSTFGNKRVYNTGDMASYHKGIDIVGARGTPVRASNGGRVSLAEAMRSNGNIVLVNHGHGISTIYSHMSKILVSEGQWVKRGEIIGEVGSTGISTGPHLHFGFSVNDIRVDPLPWIQNEIEIYFHPVP